MVNLNAVTSEQMHASHLTFDKCHYWQAQHHIESLRIDDAARVTFSSMVM